MNNALLMKNSETTPNVGQASGAVVNLFPGVSYFDCTDLVFYLAHHKMPSGIQRVTLQIFKEIFDRIELWPSIEFVAFDKSRQRYVALDRSDWLMLINHVIKYGVDDDLQTKFQAANNGDWSVFSGRVVKTFSWAGSRIFIIGAGWVSDCVPALAEARIAGAVVTLLVYDLIPLRRPEFFTMGTRAQFESWLKPMLAITDHVFAISKHAANDVEQYAAEIGLTNVAVTPIRLGTFNPDGLNDSSDGESGLATLGDYALFVSTIEARKNHILLFRVWQELIREGIKLPKLVFVGRMGWNIEELQRNLEQTQNLDGQIEIYNDLTDYELSELYKNAKFAVYPSWCEGWGLPVTEAIAAGCPVIASSATAIPEAGGTSALYLAPDDFEGWKENVREWAQSSDPRQFVDLASFEVPSWSDSLSQLLRVDIERVGSGSPLPVAPSVKCGREYLFAHQPHSRAQSHAIASAALTYVSGVLPQGVFDIQSGRVGRAWSERESWGSWTLMNQTARIVLRADAGLAGACLLLDCQFVDEVVGMKFVLTVGSVERDVVIAKPKMTLCIEISDQDLVDENLDIAVLLPGASHQVKHLHSLHGRALGVGFKSLMIIRKDDLPLWTQISTRISQASGTFMIV